MHTAWTKKGSSLPSDRIPSRTQTPQPAKAKAKGKGKEETPPKSKEVRALEKLRDDLRNASGRERDPKGGCFCQGVYRAHTILDFFFLPLVACAVSTHIIQEIMAHTRKWHTCSRVVCSTWSWQGQRQPVDLSTEAAAATILAVRCTASRAVYHRRCELIVACSRTHCFR